jgi:hypothetical protein
MGRDRGDLLDGDLARAGGEDEAERVGAELSGELGVGEIGVGADLDPHAGYSEARWSSWVSAAAGSGWRMSVSPMRKAS